MGRPAYQDNWRAEEELAVPEFPMKAAEGSRNVEQVIKIVEVGENRNSYIHSYYSELRCLCQTPTLVPLT